ncbi:Uncharacterized protein SCF082_LOCUS4179, partial [Durusdinium trenchii]
YEEFSEALTRLWEEKNGIDQNELDFGLPPVEDQWDWWYDDDGNEVDSPDGDMPHDAQPSDDDPAPTTTTTSASAAAGGNSGAAPAAERASAGSSPSRGGLSAGPPSLRAVSVQSWEDDPHDAWDGDGWWPDGGDQQWHEQWPEDDWGEWHEEPHGESTLAAVEEEDDQLKEAQQAEQAAEQLAMEAKRTWVEAQRTTQQMRKDRGFGQAGQGPKCFQCGGPHFVRDCPDRRHPPYSIGKGKGKSSYMADYSDQQLFFMKGKGKKGKGKSKHASMVSHDSFWTSKSKGKQRGKMTPPSRPAVNAYTMHYDLGGLELYEDMNNLSATMPEAEQDMVDFIKNLKPPAAKKPSQPPDTSRAIQMDPRDPRAQNCWPCYNRHVQGTWQSNMHGTWSHCEICNLRLAYIPKKGAPSNSTQALNHVMIKRMLTELEPLMQGTRPTARICKAMMDKITADTQLETLVQQAISTPVKKTAVKSRSAPNQHPSSPVKQEPTGYQTPPAIQSPPAPSSSASWELLQTDANDLQNLLTDHEKAQLMKILRDRRQEQEELPVMHMVNLMTASLMTVALQINLEGRMGMWEIACSENSWLTSAANDHGINSRRINYVSKIVYGMILALKMHYLLKNHMMILNQQVTLMLSAAALNSTEYTKGYSSYQWCYGKDYTLEDEDIRTFHDPLQDGNSMSYEALTSQISPTKSRENMNKKNLIYQINPILIKLLYLFEELASSSVSLLLAWFRQQFVVNDYGTGSAPSTGPPVPTAPAEEPSSIVPPDEKRRKTDHDDSDLFNASSRQLPNYSDVNWLNNMVVEEDQSWECFETILDDNPDVMTMEFELNFTSN